MGIIEKRKQFENNKTVYESARLLFHGVKGFDVYNPSVPFIWNGKEYIYGRIERRNEWARSWVRLFENTGKDDWTLVPNSMIYQLEDPFISIVGNILVLGGTHVRIKSYALDTYHGYFYKGSNINDLYYFTTGPDYMKDIRLVELNGGLIGVFSRHRNERVRKKFGSESLIGFTRINSLDALTADVIEDAPYIPGLFDKDEWGGCNQAYCLDSGLIGIIGHQCYKDVTAGGQKTLVYINVSFVFDPDKHEVVDRKVIGTRSCYPAGPAKKPDLTDVAFTSGIVMRNDGKADLFSGIGDCEAGRIVIDNPFEGYGGIVDFNRK